MQERTRKIVFWSSIVIVILGIIFLLGYFIKQNNDKEYYENLRSEVSEQENVTEEIKTEETEESEPVVIPIDFETL